MFSQLGPVPDRIVHDVADSSRQPTPASSRREVDPAVREYRGIPACGSRGVADVALAVDDPGEEALRDATPLG